MDEIYLARRHPGAGLRALVRLPIRRWDRNLPEGIEVADNRMVVMVNGGVDLFEPFFLKRTGATWELIERPRMFEVCISHGDIVSIEGNLVCVVNVQPEKEDHRRSTLIVFGPDGLKHAKLPFVAGSMRRAAEREIEFEKWHYHTPFRITKSWVRYRWPFRQENGYWVSDRTRR